MKIRIFSAFVLSCIFIPILIIGGNLFNLFIVILSIIGLNEFLKIKESKKELPFFIKLLSFIIFILVIISNIGGNSLIYKIDYRLLSSIFLLFLIPTVFYHNRKIYSVNDAFFLIGSVLFLGISFSLIILLRNISLINTIYLLLISICGDVYAYIFGKYIGGHKLLKEISPNKTIEGLIGGLLFGTFIPFMYLTTFVPCDKIYTIIVTFFLALLGQLGDLCFSAIKRYYSKKDFSNLLPGYGGIIDLLDSFIFILLGFMFFMVI